MNNDPAVEIAQLRHEMLVMKQRMALLTKNTTSVKSEFEVNWWIPIRESTPDLFFRDLVVAKEGDLEGTNLDPDNLWRTVFSPVDKALLLRKVPEVSKIPELSSETWGLVSKDEVLKAKAQIIQKAMVVTKNYWNVWIAILKAFTSEEFRNMPHESRKHFNVMTAMLSMEASQLVVELRNVGRESINAPKVDTKRRQYADEDDAHIYARERVSHDISTAIVVGMKSAGWGRSKAPPQQTVRRTFPSRAEQRVALRSAANSSPPFDEEADDDNSTSPPPSDKEEDTDNENPASPPPSDEEDDDNPSASPPPFDEEEDCDYDDENFASPPPSDEEEDDDNPTSPLLSNKEEETMSEEET
jgi:hypothetical protein